MPLFPSRLIFPPKGFKVLEEQMHAHPRSHNLSIIICFPDFGAG